jgi:hypothetical protein
VDPTCVLIPPNQEEIMRQLGEFEGYLYVCWAIGVTFKDILLYSCLKKNSYRHTKICIDAGGRVFKGEVQLKGDWHQSVVIEMFCLYLSIPIIKKKPSFCPLLKNRKHLLQWCSAVLSYFSGVLYGDQFFLRYFI